MELLRFTLQQVSYAIVEPSFSCLLILMGVVFYLKNRKTTIVEKMIMGKCSYSAFELTISQIVMGIVGGVLVTIALNYLGITFLDTSSIYILFVISIIFIYIKPELGCFSYSAAVLGFASIVMYGLSVLFEKPEISKLNIDITNLVMLVGVMHMVEGLLVMLDGKRGAIPVFGSKGGKIIGGFAYKRQWIFPMAILLIMQSSQVASGSSSIQTPDWWPLLNHSENLAYFATVVIGALPIFAGINYTSVTFTKKKSQKPLYSGLLILAYGSMISFISLFGGINIFIDAVIVAIMPISHHFMLYLDRIVEEKGVVRFVSGDEGLCVLAVAPDSVAKSMGLDSGDIIMEINNIKADSDEIVFGMMDKIPKKITMKVKKANGVITELLGKTVNEEKLGLVVVPRVIPKQAKVTKLNIDGFDDVLRNIKNKKKKK